MRDENCLPDSQEKLSKVDSSLWLSSCKSAKKKIYVSAHPNAIKISQPCHKGTRISRPTVRFMRVEQIGKAAAPVMLSGRVPAALLVIVAGHGTGTCQG